ncbi:MAG: hypothetical protein ACC631_07940 [Halocynthiibacter sp.]
MSAPGFAVAALTSRIFWAMLTLSLTALLGASDFGNFAFIQITSVIVAQIVFGVLSNLVGARMSIASNRLADHILTVTLVYAAAMGALIFLALAVVGFAGFEFLSSRASLILVLWIYAVFATGLTTGRYVAMKRYRRLATLFISQLVCYAAALFLFGLRSGEMAALASAVGQILPIVALLCYDKKLVMPAGRKLRMVLGQLVGEHKHATYMNMAFIPSHVVLWLLVAGIAQSVGDSEMARYGIGNQFATLFLFLPSAIANIAITHLSRTPGAANKTQSIVRISAVLLGIGAGLTPLAYFSIGLASGWAPALIIAARPEITIGLAMATLVAARAPFAWHNQIEKNSTHEVAVAIISAVVLSVPLVLGTVEAGPLMTYRALAAFIGLMLSAFLYFQVRPRHRQLGLSNAP